MAISNPPNKFEKSKSREIPTGLVIILVIMVILVLGFFIILSAGPNGTNSGPNCITKSGYTCDLISYSHTTGNVTLIISQSSGATWTSAYFEYVPSGAPYVNDIPAVSWNNSVSISNMTSGSTRTIILPVSGPVPTGTTGAGIIWSRYELNAGGTFYYTEIAPVNLKAA